MHRIYSKAGLLILKLIEGDRSMENNQRRERMCAKTARSQPTWKVNWSDLLPDWILSGQNWNPNIANSKIPLQRCAFSHINQLTSSAREPEVICVSQQGSLFLSSLFLFDDWCVQCSFRHHDDGRRVVHTLCSPRCICFHFLMSVWLRCWIFDHTI